MLQERKGSTAMHGYDCARDQIDAIYAGERLELPFTGVVLGGY